MDKQVHFAALKAAARVAFGVTILAGCTAAENQEDTVASESEINAKAPCPTKADAGPKPDAKPSCDSVLASAFPDGGDDFAFVSDPTKKPQVSDDVKACCTEKLLDQSEASWQFQYRWACCGALDNWNNPDRAVSLACTPWGPPVPPSMKRRSRTLRAVA